MSWPRDPATVTDDRRSNFADVGDLPTTAAQPTTLDFGAVLPPAFRKQRWCLAVLAFRGRQATSDQPRIIECTLRFGPHTTETLVLDNRRETPVYRVFPPGWDGRLTIDLVNALPNVGQGRIWARVELLDCTTLADLR